MKIEDFENLTEVIDRINEETEYSAYIKETDREYLIIEKDQNATRIK